MSCFSVGAPAGVFGRMFGPKVEVASTTMFARMIASGVQGLACSLRVRTKQEVALVLPLPVRPGGGERGLRFLDLRHRPTMFEDLDSLFDESPPSRRIVAKKVGTFMASYLPTREDFARLDPKFRLPAAVFDAVPHYRDYAFAVLQLPPTDATLHPVGIRFATSEFDRLYFPTVHVLDGRWHPTIAFDHTLYYQHPKVLEPGDSWDGDEPGRVLPSHTYSKLVDHERPVLRRFVHGVQENADTWVGTGRPKTIHTT